MMIQPQIKSRLLLWLFPGLYFASGLLVMNVFGSFYQRLTDPEYFHLLNGINIALFNLATPYTDHPGTPLQVIVALSSWPVSFAIPGSLVNNVIDNPELFLKAAILLKNLIVSFVLFIAGKRIYSFTGNMWLALTLQLLPFGNAYAMTVFGRLNPESLMLLPVALLLIFMVRYICSEPQKGLRDQQVKYLAMTGGLGMAIKFSYFPFLLVPVFLFKSFKRMAGYGVLSIVFTLIFAIPILFNFSKSTAWFGNMLVNSGHWGSGNSTFIDWGEVPSRLLLILDFDHLFPVLFTLLVVLLLYARFFAKIKSKEINKLNLLTMGVVSGVLISVFFITKHFAYRYYITTLYFQVVLFYLIFEYVVRIFRFRLSRQAISVMAFLVYLTIAVWQIPAWKNQIGDTAREHRHYAAWAASLQDVREQNVPLIISAHYSGCPFPEFSLNNAYLLCGNLKTTFSDALRQKYPRSMIYVDWSEQFYHWDEFLDAGDFILPDEGVYVFIGQGRERDLDVVLDRIGNTFPGYTIRPLLLDQLKAPAEFFYKIEFSKKK
jgi:hypothetical protein